MDPHCAGRVARPGVPGRAGGLSETIACGSVSTHLHRDRHSDDRLNSDTDLHRGCNFNTDPPTNRITQPNPDGIPNSDPIGNCDLGRADVVD